MRASIIVVALCLAFTTAARAQEVDPSVRELYQQGAAAYRDGRFTEAVELLERAYRMHPDPVLLYNIARAAESAGDTQRAYDAYLHFLGDAPANAEQRPRVQRRVEVLRATLDAEQHRATETTQPEEQPTHEEQSPEPPHAEVPLTPPPSGSPSPVPWAVAGIGVAAIGVGIVVGVLALNQSSAAETAPSHAEAFAIATDANELSIIANVLLFGGGAITLASAIWGIIDILGSNQPQRASNLRITPTPGGLLVFGTF